MPRLDRGIQYPPVFAITASIRYWIARSSRAMTKEGGGVGFR